LIAETAFLNDTPWTGLYFFVWFSPSRYCGVISFERFPIKGARLVGAGWDAVTAADAQVIVHHHNPIVPVIAGSHWANGYTRSMFTMLAGNREVYSFITNLFNFVNLDPGDVWWGVITGPTCLDAVPTSVALLLVDHHYPTVFTAFCI